MATACASPTSAGPRASSAAQAVEATTDVFSLHAQLIAETRHLSGAATLKHTKPSANLLNTARRRSPPSGPWPCCRRVGVVRDDWSA